MAEIEMTVEGFEPEEFEQLKRDVSEAMSLAMRYTAIDVFGNTKRFAPVDQGRLQGSFNLEQVDELTWRIFTNVHYALNVHEGTGIYGPTGQPIQPVRAQALKFFWKKTGQMMIFKGDLPDSFQRARFGAWAEERGMTPVFAWVQGQPAQPYADDAIEATSRITQQFIQRAIRETG